MFLKLALSIVPFLLDLMCFSPFILFLPPRSFITVLPWAVCKRRLLTHLTRLLSLPLLFCPHT